MMSLPDHCLLMSASYKSWIEYNIFSVLSYFFSQLCAHYTLVVPEVALLSMLLCSCLHLVHYQVISCLMGINHGYEGMGEVLVLVISGQLLYCSGLMKLCISWAVFTAFLWLAANKTMQILEENVTWSSYCNYIYHISSILRCTILYYKISEIRVHLTFYGV